MRNSWIISFAAICGVAAFIYTLAAGAPSNRWRDRQRGGGSPAGLSVPNTSRSASPLPDTLEGLQEFVQNNPRSGRAYFELARRYDDIGRAEDARAAWEEAARLRLAATARNSDNADVWFEAGWSLMQLDRAKEAQGPLTEAERRYSAIAPESRTDQTWYRLGWARKLLGQDQDAVIAWARARDLVIEQTPVWDARGLYNLACYQALVGDREEALVTLEKAVFAGWTDAARAQNDADLALIRDEQRFTQALTRMRESPGGVRVGPG